MSLRCCGETMNLLEWFRLGGGEVQYQYLSALVWQFTCFVQHLLQVTRNAKTRCYYIYRRMRQTICNVIAAFLFAQREISVCFSRGSSAYGGLNSYIAISARYFGIGSYDQKRYVCMTLHVQTVGLDCGACKNVGFSIVCLFVCLEREDVKVISQRCVTVQNSRGFMGTQVLPPLTLRQIFCVSHSPVVPLNLCVVNPGWFC